MRHIEEIGEHVEVMPPGQPGQIMDRTLYVMRGLCRPAIARGLVIVVVGCHAPSALDSTIMRRLKITLIG
jgi:hypothetical protein